ncbi:Zn(II)2Cys6 transcription factor [Aspergillus novofumigatus IBT 16806]|uniref:C6 finger domain protein n=1 Tax=Aspergillus novofumigatus (strain IBT 16806) TaxID=1392255 RepID=A0A2I1BWS7_ASPN1|nr:C6 finger domain protein [Aspergillus novofumigatus IBT 16806]PKX89829.1 C6 finger domain protein [Aspergillus novofumigatus IBT 16806]
MSDSQSNQQKGLPASTATPTAKAGARKKTRPTYSCLNCHKRKVKCDRVKPCGACCLRGTPSECEYGTSKRDRHYIQQSALIDNLMQTCEDLKKQLAEARALANLPPVKHEDPFSVSSPNEVPLPSEEEEAQDLESRDDSSLIKKTADPSDRLVAESTKTPWENPGQTSRSLSEDKRVLTDPAVARSFVEVFVERLIDNFSPQPASLYGGTVALREASGMRVLSPMLCTAFEAASLTFAGKREQIREVEAVGHARYVRVLRQLQTALNDPKQNKSTEVMVVVLLFTIIEAFKQSSKDSLLKHQLGGLQLLQARTPYRHRYGIDRSLYVDLRLYWVTAALVQRKPTFLASKEWLTVPWPGDAPSKDILHRLLDIAVDIPAYLGQIDDFAAALRSGTVPSTELVAQQTAIWDRATELQSRLNLWKSMFADTYAPGRAWEEPAPDAATKSKSETTETTVPTFPTFMCRDPATMELVPAKLLVYPDLLSATCMTYYWALHLIVSTTDSGLVSVLGLQERYQYACNICRSMKYYVENIPGCLVSRTMFVLRTAFDAFADGMAEKEFVTEVFRHIAAKFHLSVFSNQCASSSVKG